MSDLLCAVCREPWDSYGVREASDMAPWEVKLFRAGAGCPCCKGVAPEGEDNREAHARSIVMGDDDGDEALDAIAVLEAPTRPAWVRPENPVVWECEGCGSKVRRDVDVREPHMVHPGQWDIGRAYVMGLEWDVARKSRQHEAHRSDEWEGLLQDTLAAKLAAPEDRMLDGKPYCPACAESCGDCGALCHEDELILPDGHYGVHDAVCEDCYDKIPRCSHCSSKLSDSEETDEDGRGPCCREDKDENADEDATVAT